MDAKNEENGHWQNTILFYDEFFTLLWITNWPGQVNIGFFNGKK
jgi:hypothetical protein